MTKNCTHPSIYSQPLRKCVGIRSCTLASLICFCVGCFATSSSVAGDVQIVAQVASNWTYRGTTETGDNPAIGIAVDWQATERVFVGVEMHQAEVDAVSQRHRSFLVYAGAGMTLGKKWYATGLVSHREFPGSAREWDTTEFGLQFDHTAGWTFGVDYSPDYYEHNTAAIAADIGYRHELGRHLYVYGNVGVIEFSESRFPDYGFGSIGTGVRLGRVVLDVSYRANTEGSDSRFGMAPLSNPGFVAQLNWRLR